jgi:hypothetical protein
MIRQWRTFPFMATALVSVIETATFAARAKDRMSEQEVTDAITMIATDRFTAS